MQPNVLVPGGVHSAGGSDYAQRLVAKELAAKEAIGRSLLGVQRTIDRYAALQRFAPLVLSLLIAVGTLTIIVTGAYISGQLLDAGVEKRSETTTRLIDEAMQSRLHLSPDDWSPDDDAEQ
jgi:hypothetical protein